MKTRHSICLLEPLDCPFKDVGNAIIIGHSLLDYFSEVVGHKLLFKNT